MSKDTERWYTLILDQPIIDPYPLLDLSSKSSPQLRCLLLYNQNPLANSDALSTPHVQAALHRSTNTWRTRLIVSKMD